MNDASAVILSPILTDGRAVSSGEPVSYFGMSFDEFAALVKKITTDPIGAAATPFMRDDLVTEAWKKLCKIRDSIRGFLGEVC